MIRYRPEIDGLRAVSVVGVVLYHAGLGFSGGYVGVDVFFVISGFLITSIIVKGIQAGTFSLADFWVRRIRRILPAVATTTAVVLLMGGLLLDSFSFAALAESAAAQSALLSNVYFWKTTDYFTEAAEFKPLLHTWSLAVEEQFYLIFPLALALTYRYLRPFVLRVLAAAALLSLAVSVYATWNHEAAAFFLLPTRAWELLAGALIAASQGRLRLSRGVAELLSLGGLAGICVAMLLFDESTPFPGYYALLPVGGAAAFIAGCENTQTLSGRVLSLRPVVFIGLISYSLYLWHWPLFSFTRHVLIEVDAVTTWGLVLASFLLASLSWKFVENPFRKGRLLSTRSSAYGFGALVTAVLILVSTSIWRMDGLPGRHGAEVHAMAEDISWNGAEFSAEDGGAVLVGSSQGNRDETQPDFVLWGDSHAKTMAALVDQRARAHGLAGEVYLSNGVIPIPGLWRASWDAKRRESNLEFNRRTLQSILDRNIPHLILVSRWANNCGGRSQLDIANGSRLTETLVTDREGQDEPSLTPEQASASVGRQLQNMLARLSKAGTQVWLIRQIPETDNLSTARHFYMSKRYPLLNRMERFTTSLSDHRRRQAAVDEALRGIESPRLTVLDPAPLFFSNEEARVEIFSERAYYRDDNHLTRIGVERFLTPVFDEIFQRVRGAD